MDIVRSTADMVDACRRTARPLGLVPTMGALHAGHLSLVDRSLADNAATAVSIFVNPTQFGADEDLSLYPRDLEGDLELLRQRGAALVFVPEVAEVYPPGFDTWVDVGPAAERLEGGNAPVTSGVWPPSWRNCLTSRGPTGPISGKRTASRRWWCESWSETWTWGSKSSSVPPFVRKTGWP